MRLHPLFAKQRFFLLALARPWPLSSSSFTVSTPHILHLFLTCLKYYVVFYVYQQQLCKLLLSSNLCYLSHDLIGLVLLSSLLLLKNRFCTDLWHSETSLSINGSVHHKFIPIYIQQDATLHSLFYLENVLNVSGGTTTHHQERTQLYLQHLLFVTPLLLPAASGR
jgi:hypothetical protein